MDLRSAPTIVGACCLLHNFVQLRGEAEPHEQNDPHPNGEEPVVGGRCGSAERREMALSVRSTLFRQYSLQNALPSQ